MFRAAIVSLLLVTFFTVSAQERGSSFTYQGQLTEAGQPATGLYDLQACLFDSLLNDTLIACQNKDDVPVDAGLFTISLDFGAPPFNGQARYLEFRVRPSDSLAPYTPLEPRQLLRAAPEALRADEAGTAEIAEVAISMSWLGLTGIPPGFSDGVDNDSGGTVTNITAGTGLSGGSITTSGTISIADGGVAAEQIAPGAVGSAQIDTQEVQSRIVGSCALGSYLRGINQDGSVICSELINQTQIQIPTDPYFGDSGKYSSLAIDSDGIPVISSLNSSSNTVAITKCHDMMCSDFTTEFPAGSRSGGSYSSLTLGTDGLPVISYHSERTEALMLIKCNDSACSGQDDRVTTLDDTNDPIGLYTSVEVGPDGFPIISYIDSIGNTLKIAKCNDVECADADETITSITSGAYFPSLAIGVDGFPIIAYHNNSIGSLSVIKCNDPACTGGDELISVVDNPVNDVGMYADIAIGTDGLPVISYLDQTAGTLKVAKCNDAACTDSDEIISIVDSDLGGHSSITIGADSLPIISYAGSQKLALKVARCNDPACAGNDEDVRTVDDGDGDNVGSFSSIEIGMDGLPIISYYDWTNSRLKFAKCGTQSCR